MVKAVQNSFKLYSQHIREEQQRKKTNEKEKEQAEAHKRTLDEMKQEKKSLHENSYSILHLSILQLKRPCKEL